MWWHLFDVTVLEPIEQSFHLIRLGRRLVGLPVRALNLHDSRLADSAFFTDRDPAQLSPEQVRWGPTRLEDMSAPPYTVTKRKEEGKTPGLFVTDARGVRYLFKFDPVDAPELLSGAEVVTSKLLYALGYHVPSYEIVLMGVDELRPGQGITAADLQALIGERAREGRVRVAASRILEGEVLGPARFKRFRDCADVRALKLAYAWVNNIDAKDHNSLLVWNGTETVGYLFDFGTSLGADAGLAGPKTPCAGWRNIVDLREASKEVVTLGLHRSVCDPQEEPVDASVGFFTAHLDPERWKPYAPNPAFKQMNDDDARWMAQRLARLSRAQIEAAVSAGRYTNPDDAAYLVETLERRRHAILDEYLDEPREEVAAR